MSHLTKDESTLIERFILLPIVRKVLERDLTVIQQSPLKVKDPYTNLIDVALQHLGNELREVKQAIYRQNIKVFKNKTDETFTEYRYFCRGYEGRLTYMNANLKMKTKQCIEHYFLTKPR